MFLNTAVWIKVMLAILIAFVVSFALTPVVKILAQKLGAMDDRARPGACTTIPSRMGGLAIFLGFIVSMLLFADITQEVRGILLGSIIIVITGVIDDIISPARVDEVSDPDPRRRHRRAARCGHQPPYPTRTG